MTAKIIDGKALASRIRSSLKNDIQKLSREKGYLPGLAVILVGKDPASQIYVRNKEKACKEIGIESRVIYMEENISQDELLREINTLNNDKSIHGILVQLPLPSHIDEDAVISAIDPMKDVDGFHPVTTGKLFVGQMGFEPCTPKGIITLIKETGQDITGKHAVVIGRSNIVGKPVAIMLLRENATVTICHSKTKKLKEISKNADILVVAMGRPESIDDGYIKEGAIVIDVGTTRVDGKLKGDVVFDKAVHKAGWITPVPGGVGPMTITMLLKNTILAAYGNE
ncbi:MAG: bifunctional methylenetetrahydrofolate dehydrogenase/methenyltetrahydrofolate cyclohydrolase FolD [Clostridiales bacterium]|nr:bifunctional methylenetetrahydrofolate dehydrogenase/methenyltetrahydrofolate cyclohydrolase FolD [Clostridiales bacterium]